MMASRGDDHSDSGAPLDSSPPPRNLVICFDGTSNEPETGATAVTRLYQVAEKSDAQLVYYDPGVGTMGARAAVTGWGKSLTR
ncbi:phospholipase effector Tle1 domain-containing protein, partial [Microbacterium sp. P5_E9]